MNCDVANTTQCTDVVASIAVQPTHYGKVSRCAIPRMRGIVDDVSPPSVLSSSILLYFFQMIA